MNTLRKNIVFAIFKHQTISTVAVNSAVANDDSVEGRPWREIPGPSKLPIIGHLHHFLPGGSLNQEGASIFDLLADKYGPIVKFEGSFGSLPFIFLFDAEAASHVLRSENWMPVRIGFESLNYFRNKYYNKKGTNGTTGLMSDQGEKWKSFRSTVNPIMLHTKTIKLYRNSLNEVAEDMIDRMRSIRNEKNMIKENFDVEMNLWALESIGVIAFGGRLNCLDSNLPENSPERKLIQTVHNIFNMLEDIEVKPSLWRYISTPLFNRLIKAYEDQVELSKFFISKALEQFQSKKKNSNEEKSILEKLLEIDEEVAVIMASDMLFGGVDTISNTMIGLLYLLAKNPEKQNRLREEIMSNREKKPYLKACLKESLRLMPVIRGNLRTTTKEYNLFGYKIPKNMTLVFGHQRLSVMENHFLRPKEYIPERWIVDKNDPLYYGNANPFAYNPFGFGVRSCIGRRIAELEIETFLAKLIENFQVEWVGPPLKVKSTILNYRIAPFNFIFKDIK